MRLYLVVFPIDDLRLAVETAKRILTKEKIDRQLAGQSTLIPYIKVRDGYHNKMGVTVDTQDRLDDKIDKLTSMMSKLTAQGNNQNKQFKPKMYECKKIGQTKDYYDHSCYQNRLRSNSGDRRMSFRGRAWSRERHCSSNFRRNDQSSSSRSKSGLRASRDIIRCFKCREYDHFPKDCLNSETERESEQIQ